MPVRRHHLTALALASTLAFGGCGSSSAEPDPLPKSPASTSSTAPTPPALPAAAKQKNKAGAVAAARHFLKAMAHAGETGDTASFDSTYASTCTKCAAISDGIRSTYSAGGSITGGAWVPQEVRFYSIAQGVATLDVVVDYQEQTWVKDKSAKESFSPPREGVLKAFQLVWRGGRWQVGALDPEL